MSEFESKLSFGGAGCDDLIEVLRMSKWDKAKALSQEKQ